MAQPDDSGVAFGEFEARENQGVQDAKPDLAGQPRELTFEGINEITIKVTDGKKIISARLGGGAGEMVSRAVGWLTYVGGRRWIARVKNRSSRPLPISAAKKGVLSMLAHKGEGRRVDVIEDLHRWHWEYTEPMPSLSEVWAIETANYPPLTLPPITTPPTQQLEPECDDGGELLPAFLDRRKPTVAEAA